MSSQMLDLSCSCGARIRYNGIYITAHRDAFEKDHEVCRQPKQRLYTPGLPDLLVSGPLRRKIADQWAEIETLRVNIAEVIKDRDLILDAKMKVETDNQRLRQRVAEVVAEKNRILNDNREVGR